MNPNSDEKKSLFEILQPKQAFILGCVTSVLVLGTAGFLLLGTYVVRGQEFSFNSTAGGGTVGVANGNGAAAAKAVQAPTTVVPEAPSGEVPVVTAADHVRGDTNAPITIVEYSDFQCPFCARFHPTMQQIMEEYDGKVKWVYRHYPLSFHPEAKPSAEASECAGEQGKFWEYADALVENQAALSSSLYTKLAEDLGLDTSDFASCLSSDKYLDVIDTQLQGGMAAGVTGTPGSFVIGPDGNAQSIKGALPFSSIKPLIDQML